MKAKYYWHIHHNHLIEAAYEPIINRKLYIRSDKPAGEVPLRLKLLKRAKLPKWIMDALYENQHQPPRVVAAIKRLHKKQCHPRCPWESTQKYGPLSGDILLYLDEGGYHFTLKPLKKKRKARK